MNYKVKYYRWDEDSNTEKVEEYGPIFASSALEACKHISIRYSRNKSEREEMLKCLIAEPIDYEL